MSFLFPSRQHTRKSTSTSKRSRKARARRRNRPARGRRLLHEPLERRDLLALVAVFDNGSYVDTSGGTGAESDNLQASLTSLGHTVSTFTATGASGINTALSGKDVVSIPEQEKGDLVGALDASAKAAYRNIVSGGGGLIIHGYDSSRADDFLNGVFGFSLSESRDSSGNTYTRTSAAVGTQFSDDPPSIPWNSGVSSVISGLPSGSSTIYQRSDGAAAVALMPYGSGQIAFLGWDWFNAAPNGSADSGWLQVLDSAVLEVSNQPPVVTDIAGYTNPDSGTITFTADAHDSDGGHIVLNEINTGGGDWVELYNYGPDQDMTGWSWYWQDQRGHSGTYSFPSGFVLSSQSTVLVVHETGGSDTASNLYMGSNMMWTASSSGGIAGALYDNAGNCVDFFRMQGSTEPVPATTSWTSDIPYPVTDDVARRIQDADTDSGSDWAVGGSSTQNALNPGQTGVGGGCRRLLAQEQRELGILGNCRAVRRRRLHNLFGWRRGVSRSDESL